MNFCTALRGWGLRREKGHFLKHVHIAMIPPRQCEGAAGFPPFSAGKCYCRENTFYRGVNHSNISCTFLQNPKISRKSEIPEIQNKKSQRKPHEFQKIPKKIPRNSKYQKKIRKTIQMSTRSQKSEKHPKSSTETKKDFKNFKLLWHFKK